MKSLQERPPQRTKEEEETTFPLAQEKTAPAIIVATSYAFTTDDLVGFQIRALPYVHQCRHRNSEGFGDVGVPF